MNKDKYQTDIKEFSRSRRRFLELNLGAAIAAGTGLSSVFGVRAAEGAVANNGRILVVLELSGGNDGLNTVVPYTQD